jgi:tetratricopeptide (TPR) repeat protein
VADGEEILDLAETLRRGRRRAGRGAGELQVALSAVAARTHRRLLATPLPAAAPCAGDRALASEQLRRLQELSPEEQLAVVRTAGEFQVWAIAERCCEESIAEASRDLDRAAHLARLAMEIAARAQGPEGWRNALSGWVAGHRANVLRVTGELAASRAGFTEAKELWRAGADLGGLLDPGKLLDLEASLCRAERRFEEALALLEQARSVSRYPARILINKGFTLEAMGRYEQAIEALREAEPLVDRETSPSLWYKLHANLAVDYCHVGRHQDGAELLVECRRIAGLLGEEIDLIRMTWLEGRIAAGLGLREAALALLAEARRRFAEKGLGYDVALCLLEEAVLLLEEGRTAEVEALAGELEAVFRAKGVHREALAALRLFHQAAGSREATADLARRLLAWLFRARHDPGLRFPGA